MEKNIALYTINNTLVSPLIDTEEKPANQFYILGIPIFIGGQMIYNKISEAKVLHGQEIWFPLAFQVFFDSLLFKTYTPIFMDAFLTVGAIVTGNYI